jgi:hypothetical protein
VRRRHAAQVARRRRLFSLLAFLGLLGIVIAAAKPAAVRAEAGGPIVAEPVVPASAAGATLLFGPSPNEAAGEVWGEGTAPGGNGDLIHYTDEGGWEPVPYPVEEDGGTQTELEIPHVANAGRTTPAGGVVTVAQLGPRPETNAESKPEALLVRDPGGQFRAVEPPEGFLAEGELLFQREGLAPSVHLAAVEEADGKTGAFILPFNTSGKILTSVIHYDGSSWTREPICVTAAPAPCDVPAVAGTAMIAIEAAGPGNAWMLARLPRESAFKPGKGLALLHRTEGEWRLAPLGGPLGALYAVEESTVAGKKVFVTPREKGQPLTVSGNGVWVDASVQVGSREARPSSATVYYDSGEGDPGFGQLTGAWCDPLPGTEAAVIEPFCPAQLHSDLAQGEGRSFAWAGSGAAGDFGTRAITGIGRGAMLVFENGAWSRIPLAGNGGAEAGAALSSPDEGWLGPSLRLTREPIRSSLVPWPLPFRHPLTAVAPQPGVPVGELSSEALAVGESGQVARYLPGIGWQPESLLSGNGSRATPNLTGVAWPTPGLAFAVGSEGAMWLWRASTNLWEADPGAPSSWVHGNFTAIAFDPNEPERGYAVGQQGLLLGYGRRWEQEALPPELGPEPNFTSVAFAGNEAIATWTEAIAPENPNFVSEAISGVIVNDGTGWRAEPQAAEALLAAAGRSSVVSATEGRRSAVPPRLVAGLPDGGAVIAGGTGEIIEREGAGDPWHAVPGSQLGQPAALSAVREGGQLRAIVSVESSPVAGFGYSPSVTEEPQGAIHPGPDQPPLLLEPYGLPPTGFIVRQTATGWRDEEHQAFPTPGGSDDQESSHALDMPRMPDAVLALLVSPDGSRGWAVGGQTGEQASAGAVGEIQREGLQTSAAMRFGEEAAPPPNAATAPVPVTPGEATFAIGGNAQCADTCADLSKTGIGPDVWLENAVGKAAATPGVRAFLYTGSSVAKGLELAKISPDEFGEEEAAYADRLGSAAGALPVFAAPSPTDVYESSLETFAREFEGFEEPFGSGADAGGIVPVSAGDRATGNYSYAFESSGSTGAERVRVIVLDYLSAPLDQDAQCWLAGQLDEARVAGAPAIVVANREVGTDAGLSQLLLTGADETTGVVCPQTEPGAASAYFFDQPEGNTIGSVSFGGAAIPEYGTGSLGYARIPDSRVNEFPAPSGFLLASVDTAARNPLTNVAPVGARMIPSIGSLAMYAADGTLLRRSQVALFEGLARRPEAGWECIGNDAPQICEGVEPDSYVQIPYRCVIARNCGTQIAPEYRFTSSSPDIANFVRADPATGNPRSVYLSPEGKSEPDPTSGLLCAFNSGTTTVSIETGGLVYSVPVTVQAGSVQRPCGTVPRTDLPAAVPAITPPPPPPASQPPFKSPPGALPPPPVPTPTPTPTQIPVVGPAPVVPHPVHPAPAPPPAPTFFGAPSSVFPVPGFAPPPPPTVPEPVPPSGTSTVEVSSPVAQSAVAPEEKREAEAAIQQVHHMSVYEPEGFNLPPAVPIVAVLALLVGGCGLVGTRRRERLAYVPIEARRNYVQ